MKIKLVPVVCNSPRLVASVSGDKLTINGEVFDFSALPDGALLPLEALPSCFAGDVVRVGNDVEVSIVYPVSSTSPHYERFPAAYTTPLDVKAGRVPMPQPISYNNEVESHG